jgi:hypothetical protein
MAGGRVMEKHPVAPAGGGLGPHGKKMIRRVPRRCPDPQEDIGVRFCYVGCARRLPTNPTDP